MNSLTAHSPSMPALRQESVFDRARQKVSLFWQALKVRIDRASAAFSDRVVWECSQALHQHTRSSPQELPLVGCLIALGEGDPLLLFEGNYKAQIESTGRTRLVAGDPMSDDRIRISQGSLMKRGEESKGLDRAFHTNEIIELGTERFIVKFFEEIQQVPVQIPIPEETRYA